VFEPTGTPDPFWSKVQKSDGCWTWAGATWGRGYGAFKHEGRQVYAHRFAWEMAKGPIPAGLFVCHHCDNPLCVRPDHLFLGTHTDNMRDASRKGRLYGWHVTHCPRGHEYTPENTIRVQWGKYVRRSCRSCEKQRGRLAYRVKAADPAWRAKQAERGRASRARMKAQGAP